MNATSLSEPEVRALADAINQVAVNRPAAEAEKLIELALARAPREPLVLNSAGGYHHRNGNAAAARELFERAVAIDGKAKVLWVNLAAACRSLGDGQAELAALDKALAIDPRYVLALLQKGDLLERLGRHKPAALAFAAAVDSASSGSPVPQNALSALTRAQEKVRANSRALEEFLEAEVAPVRRLHAPADQHRFDACRDVLLGKRRVYVNDPKQIHLPYLPALEFFPRELFPWLGELEAATEAIATEALGALTGAAGDFRPYVDFPAGTPVDQWESLNHSMDWSVYSLWDDGVPVSQHQQACPRTTEVLARLPMCDIPDWAPNAYFSVLKPKTRLPAHTGTTNIRSIVHLPLIVPDGCRFRVGSDTRTVERGHAWVFDDSINHEAWNDSDQTRIILIFDVWNALLTAAERDLLRAMTTGLTKYYEGQGLAPGVR